MSSYVGIFCAKIVFSFNVIYRNFKRYVLFKDIYIKIDMFYLKMFIKKR